jgi:ubiquinone/menaquinone biosynthesis C-methylase UbiE
VKNSVLLEVPDEETRNALYVDGGYAQQNPDWHQGDSPWKAQQILKMIERTGLKPQSICEIGCGAGAILANLQKSRPECTFTGYEISPQAFQLAASKSNQGLRFFHGSRPEPGQAFDLVLVIDVVEHVDDCFDFLRKLQPHGQDFILHIPLDLSVLSVLREWPLMKRRRGVGHLHYFTKATALATLEDAGYQVRDYFYTKIEEPGQALKSRILRGLPSTVLSWVLSQDAVVRIFGEYSLMVLASRAAQMPDSVTQAAK